MTHATGTSHSQLVRKEIPLLSPDLFTERPFDLMNSNSIPDKCRSNYLDQSNDQGSFYNKLERHKNLPQWNF